MNALAYTPFVLLQSGTYSGAITGPAVDIHDYQGPILVIADYGNSQAGGAGVSLSLRLETSGTASGPWLGVSGSGTFAPATVAGSQTLGFQTDQFDVYVRCVGSVAGSGRYPVSVHGVGLRQNAP